MEQNGISIISPSSITENSVGKSKSIGITLRTNESIQTAKKKFKSPWLDHVIKEEATVKEIAVFVLGEILGTAILVLIGCMGCLATLGGTFSIPQASASFGAAVMIAVQVVGHISGAHINPAVTVAALIQGKKSLPMTGIYIVAQCIGSCLGYGLIKLVTPSHLMHTGDPEKTSEFCMTMINKEITVCQGFLAEVVGTGILVFIACSTWDYRNDLKQDSVPLKIGVTVTALCIIFVPFTGCSINPARTFGPALWNGYWQHHWVFWVAPLLGSVIASVIYRFIFLPYEDDDEDIEEH